MLQSRAASTRLCRNKTISVGVTDSTCVNYAEILLNASPSTGKAITVDEKYAADTTAKVKSFQAGKNLMTDGIIGPKTWAALCAQTYTGEALTARNRACTKDGSSFATTTTVTVATWNVLKYDNKVSNMSAGMKDIFSAGASVIGLEEVNAPSFTKKSPETAAGKITFMKIGVYSPGEGSAIVWDETKLDKLSAESFRPIAGKEKRFTYVKFLDTATGYTFYVLSLHMQPGVNDKSEKCSTDNCKSYKVQMKTLIAKLKALQSSGVPIFVVGDFNVDYKNDSTCKITWWPCQQLQKAAMKNTISVLGFDTIKGKTTKYLDQVFYWTGSGTRVTPISNKILGSDATCTVSKKKDVDGDPIKHCWNGSDHRPFLSKIELGS